MKNFILILFFANILWGQKNTDNLLISTDPGFKIYINDKFVGHDNYSGYHEEGIYVITVFKDSKRWKKNIIIDTLKISNEKVIRNYTFNKKVFVDSDPQDVKIFQNDSLAGRTPLFIEKISNKIFYEKEKYHSGYFELGEKKHIKLNLKYNGDIPKEKFIKTDLAKILFGSAIVLGAASAYFKLKADNKYDHYRLLKEKSFLDETNKYDTISAISFTALQVNFGMLIYFLLID